MSFAFVALAAELTQRRRMLQRVAPGRRSLVAGAVIGPLGGGVWEIVEMIADSLFPVFIYNPHLDTVMDMVFGAISGYELPPAPYFPQTPEGK